MSSTHCSKHCTDTTTRRLKVWILIFDIWCSIFYLLPPPIWNYLYLVGKSWCKSRWRLVHTQDTQPTSLLLFWFTHQLKSDSEVKSELLQIIFWQIKSIKGRRSRMESRFVSRFRWSATWELHLQMKESCLTTLFRASLNSSISCKKAVYVTWR